VPVLREEVLACLAPQPGKLYVDATLGAGGHAEALLRALQKDRPIPSDSDADSTQTPPDEPASAGRLIGVDQDPAALAIARERLAVFGGQVRFLPGNFGRLFELLPPEDRPITGGLLVDLGVSSMQLDTPERGFSFSREAPLDMRMSPDAPLTAEIVVNTYPEDALRRIFSQYGEEHLSGTIAHAILRRRESRPFCSTTELARLVADIYAGRGKAGNIHPATRVFQALRIEVNNELGHLNRLLESLPALLAPGARVAIISFHSLEDRLVKQHFRFQARDCLCPPGFPVCRCEHRATLQCLNAKPITASEAETRLNPRARSAKLRAAIRL
jgi:16S rRNA (cytosine1402-N4)-methyltransferase